MEQINTELPLDMDYYTKGENQDTETVRSYLAEYNRVGGFTVSYYKQQDPNLFNDPIFIEKADKKWVKPIKIKVIGEYINETIENQRYGVTILDEAFFVIEKKYFLETIKSEPKIGDILKMEYAGLMFEIVNIVDTDAMFFGQKLTWKLTGKIWVNAHEDSEIENEVVEAGWLPDESNYEEQSVNNKIEDLAEEIYIETDINNPFGNY